MGFFPSLSVDLKAYLKKFVYRHCYEKCFGSETKEVHLTSTSPPCFPVVQRTLRVHTAPWSSYLPGVAYPVCTKGSRGSKGPTASVAKVRYISPVHTDSRPTSRNHHPISLVPRGRIQTVDLSPLRCLCPPSTHPQLQDPGYL